MPLALAPPRPRIRVQRWSVRRIGLTIIVLVGGVLGMVALFSSLREAGLLLPSAGSSRSSPWCSS